VTKGSGKPASAMPLTVTNPGARRCQRTDPGRSPDGRAFVMCRLSAVVKAG
jgi:hypothetical protein